MPPSLAAVVRGGHASWPRGRPLSGGPTDVVSGGRVQGRAKRLFDTATDQRWPEFSHRADALGARSMPATRLYVDRDTLGSLNLSGTEPDAFDDKSEHIELLFAAHAAFRSGRVPGGHRSPSCRGLA